MLTCCHIEESSNDITGKGGWKHFFLPLPSVYLTLSDCSFLPILTLDASISSQAVALSE